MIDIVTMLLPIVKNYSFFLFNDRVISS